MVQTVVFVHDRPVGNDEGTQDMTRFREWLSTLLFGPRCEFGCGSHVYPRDRALHRGQHCPVTTR
jgi:hypothetical protein